MWAPYRPPQRRSIPLTDGVPATGLAPLVDVGGLVVEIGVEVS
jgi:hypothetical protein